MYRILATPFRYTCRCVFQLWPWTDLLSAPQGLPEMVCQDGQLLADRYSCNWCDPGDSALPEKSNVSIWSPGWCHSTYTRGYPGNFPSRRAICQTCAHLSIIPAVLRLTKTAQQISTRRTQKKFPRFKFMLPQTSFHVPLLHSAFNAHTQLQCLHMYIPQSLSHGDIQCGCCCWFVHVVPHIKHFNEGLTL